MLILLDKLSSRWKFFKKGFYFEIFLLLREAELTFRTCCFLFSTDWSVDSSDILHHSLHLVSLRCKGRPMDDCHGRSPHCSCTDAVDWLHTGICPVCHL